MKTAIYIRVSTSSQEAENQALQLREFAGKNGWEIFKEYKDIISGKENSRPSFDMLFLEAHKKQFDVVLFWDLSRFSRSGTLFTLQKLQELKRLNIEWVSFQEPYIRSLGQFGDVIVSLLATIAKVEREKISQRTKAGLERIKLSGQKLGRHSGSKDSKQRSRRWFKKPAIYDQL